MSAGITVMNEAGLDPGIDHMLAMQCIDQIHAYGGKVFLNFLKISKCPNFKMVKL
jgi:saccharopine dehydrogenase-like NADP-dependent oxidoreductase